MDSLATLIQMQKSGLVAQMNTKNGKNAQKTILQCALLRLVGIATQTIAAQRKMVAQKNLMVFGIVMVCATIIVFSLMHNKC